MMQSLNGFSRSTRTFRVTWRNAGAVVGRRWKPFRWDVVELRPWRGRRVFQIVRYEMASANCAREMLRLRVGRDESVGAAKQPTRQLLDYWMLWKGSCSPPREAIRSRR